jgi:hypothetical protein
MDHDTLVRIAADLLRDLPHADLVERFDAFALRRHLDQLPDEQVVALFEVPPPRRVVAPPPAPKGRTGSAARAAESPVRVKSPRKPRAPKETTVIDDAIRATVRAAMGTEARSFGQLTKATQLLGTVVESALGEMVNDGDVVREGQGRGLKYRLRAPVPAEPKTNGAAKQPALFPEAQA